MPVLAQQPFLQSQALTGSKTSASPDSSHRYPYTEASRSCRYPTPLQNINPFRNGILEQEKSTEYLWNTHRRHYSCCQDAEHVRKPFLSLLTKVSNIIENISGKFAWLSSQTGRRNRRQELPPPNQQLFSPAPCYRPCTYHMWKQWQAIQIAQALLRNAAEDKCATHGFCYRQEIRAFMCTLSVFPYVFTSAWRCFASSSRLLELKVSSKGLLQALRYGCDPQRAFSAGGSRTGQTQRWWHDIASKLTSC